MFAVAEPAWNDRSQAVFGLALTGLDSAAAGPKPSSVDEDYD